jgi:tetratricopeptide (TPR) repeat protein
MDPQPANPAEPIDEERQRAYVALIDKLLLGAREKANAILTAQRELVDEGLVEMMGRYAESMRQIGKQDAAAFLEDCGKQITAFLRQQADDGSTFSPSGEQEAFLIQLLLTTANSQGDPKIVYPLLQANLPLLNLELEKLLNRWWEGVLARSEQDQKQALATVLVSLGNFLNQFPIGSHGTNQENAIAAYRNALRVYTEAELPQDYAKINYNLGLAYRALARFSANPREQIENAIAACRNALRVYTEAEQPQEYAMTNNNLGNAYCDLAPFCANPREQIENAIAAHCNALRVRTEAEQPQDWAGTNNNLGIAYRTLARFSANPREQIENAIAAHCNALRVYTQEEQPEDWAGTNHNLGTAYRALARFSANPREQIENAIAACRNALRVYTEAEQPQYYAIANNNLGLAYCNLAPFCANPREQIENAIAVYRNALRVRTEAEQPQDWAHTNNNLGLAYRTLAPFCANPREQIENAITVYRNAPPSVRKVVRSIRPTTWGLNRRP